MHAPAVAVGIGPAGFCGRGRARAHGDFLLMQIFDAE